MEKVERKWEGGCGCGGTCVGEQKKIKKIKKIKKNRGLTRLPRPAGLTEQNCSRVAASDTSTRKRLFHACDSSHFSLPRELDARLKKYQNKDHGVTQGPSSLPSTP